MFTGWGRLLRNFGESLAALLRAELTQLEGELGRTAASASIAGIFAGATVVVGFWAVGLLVALLVAILAIWLPLWASAAIVLLLFVIAAGVLARLALLRWQAVESPVRTVRRRIDEHLAWWESQLEAISSLDASTPAPSGMPATMPPSLERELGMEDDDERAG